MATQYNGFLQDYESKNNVFANLMVISTSLAIGANHILGLCHIDSSKRKELTQEPIMLTTGLILGFSLVSLARMVCKGRKGRHVLVPW